jgi:hypothetical protein
MWARRRATAENEAYGTGECVWTSLQAGRPEIHRDLRMKSVPKTAQRRRADEAAFNASMAPRGKLGPITGRVKVSRRVARQN